MAFDKIVDSAQLNADLESVADAIRDKGNTTEKLSFPAGMISAIGDIKTKESVTWNQCPPLVKAFLDDVTYDPADYSTSQIANYAPATADQSNTKPVGKTVGGKTFYNEIPNKETPFSTETTAGTLKPLDRLRWLNTATLNVRDLGGWACDGGTVKYGMLFRGAEISDVDRNLLVGELGIRVDLNLRGKNEATWNVSPLGEDVKFVRADKYAWYSLIDTETWKFNIRAVFDAVIYGMPLYFHCSMGADRSGTLACILEGLLGMSQSDIDKDYELTCFYSGTGNSDNIRARNESEWTGLINEINAIDGSTFRDKCVNFIVSLGFTADEINAFRAAMIDGTPEEVNPSISTYTVVKTLIDVDVSSEDSATQYQPYNADVTPDNGKIINSIKVTMGGKDVTSLYFKGNETVFRHSVTLDISQCIINNNKCSVINGEGYGATIVADEGYTIEDIEVKITMGGQDMNHYYSNGKIAIPNVTGDIIISASAVKSAPVNLFDSTDADILIRGRINSKGIAVEYADNQLVTGFIEASVGDTFMISSDKANNSNGYTGAIALYDSSKKYLGLLSNETTAWTWSNDYLSGSVTIPSSYGSNYYTETAYARFVPAYTDMNNILITKG